MATRKKKTQEAKVVKGSHMTITYDENNYPVTLEWDDTQLLKDVQAAIASVETTQGDTNVKTKKTRKSK